MVALYLDGADLSTMARLEPQVEGFTTNPSLMKKAGITNYKEFALKALDIAQGKPVSFEVFADNADGILNQAETISSWGENVYVKVPIVNTQGVSMGPVIEKLWRYFNAKVNITAIMTREQISGLTQFLSRRTPTILSIFAGRIADTGVDPAITCAYAKFLHNRENIKVLWASTREIYNLKQAEACGCDIITISPELLEKHALFGKDLAQYSLETVKQFALDAEGITL